MIIPQDYPSHLQEFVVQGFLGQRCYFSSILVYINKVTENPQILQTRPVYIFSIVPNGQSLVSFGYMNNCMSIITEKSVFLDEYIYNYNRLMNCSILPEFF